jgi:ubiquinone/menaquinone biosynthesis C-methylase UbiE
MNVQNAYNEWATQYDSNLNKTRDLEAEVFRKTLENIPLNKCLEIGCGTGKNSVWLTEKANEIIALDFSYEMLQRAKQKISSNKIKFVQADMNEPWNFDSADFDLITFSLVLEHIENLDAIFEKAAVNLHPGGYIYIGELHPFKRYNGSKARFETNGETTVVDCYNHHVSDFLIPAKKHGLNLLLLNEYFDNNDRSQIPRILTMLLQKPIAK